MVVVVVVVAGMLQPPDEIWLVLVGLGLDGTGLTYIVGVQLHTIRMRR